MHLSTLKDCPQCHNLKLIPVEVHGQILDVCERCHGAWFEAGELEEAWKYAHGDLPRGRALLEDEHSAWSEPLPEPHDPLTCPDCNDGLQRHHLSPSFKVELARCPTCEGVWVDESQRSAVHYAPKVRAALNEISKPTNLRYFIFQLITRLPVEFNMRTRIIPWVNRALIALNLLVFLLVLIEPNLYIFGAMIPAEITQGQNLYTLITHQFQHANVGHLFGNMVFLYLTGDSIEDMTGHYKYLLIYLAGGIVAGLAHWAVNTGSVVPMIGASGAISGLFGIYLLWFRRAKLTFMIVVFQIKIAPWIFFLIWTIYQIVGIATMVEGVAHMAHLGGLVFGLAVGWFSYKWVLARNPLLKHINGPHVNMP